MRNNSQNSRVYEQGQTITETSYDMEESDTMGATIDSGANAQYHHGTFQPDTPQNSRAVALLAYDKGQVSKSINLSTHAANIWHRNQRYDPANYTQRLRSVSTKNSKAKHMPSKIEAAWRYMARKPVQIDKNQLEYGNVLFTDQKPSLPDSLSLPSVVHKGPRTGRNQMGNRTQLHSITSP